MFSLGVDRYQSIHGDPILARRTDEGASVHVYPLVYAHPAEQMSTRRDHRLPAHLIADIALEWNLVLVVMLTASIHLLNVLFN